MQRSVRHRPPPLMLDNSPEDPYQYDIWSLSPSVNEDELLLQVPSVLPELGNSVSHLDDEVPREEDYGQVFEKLICTDEFVPLDLLTAASIGDVSFVSYLIKRSCVDPNMQGEECWTSLMYASLYKQESTVSYLLETYAKVNAQNKLGRSSLMLAAMCGHDDIVKILLKRGAALDQGDVNDYTPLLHAVSASHTETALLLIDAGANLNVRDGVYGFTALHFAAQTGQVPLIRALLNSGADAAVLTSSGESAYNLAERNGYAAAANLIHQHQNSFFSLPNLLPLAQKSIPAIYTFDDDSDLYLPSQYKPKSPYSTFFDRLNEKRDSEDKENINPFTAWPGTSIVFKQATAKSPAIEDHDPLKDITESYPQKEVEQLPKDLSSLLLELGLTKYEQHFRDNDIDLQVFLTMTGDDMKEIGISSWGARKKLLSAIDCFTQARNSSDDKRKQLRVIWSDLKAAAENMQTNGTIQNVTTLLQLLQRGETYLGF